MDADSSQEIRSQIDVAEFGEDGRDDGHKDNDDGDSTSISQAKFATQIFPSYQALNTQNDGNGNELANRSSNSNEIRSPGLEQPIATSEPKSSLRSYPKESLQNDDEIDSSFVGLAVQPLVVPSSGIPAVTGALRHSTSDKDKSLEQPERDRMDSRKYHSITDTMPRVLRDMLRRLSKELHNGEHIPHRFQVIPKDQAKLLDSDDCWQPPLIGHAQRPGTVPQVLLERLTREADQGTAPQPTPAGGADRNSPHHRTESTRSPVSHEDDARHLEDADSDDSGPTAWSESPPRMLQRGPERPPDTPPPAHGNEAKWNRQQNMRKHEHDTFSTQPSIVSQSALDQGALDTTDQVHAQYENVLNSSATSAGQRSSQKKNQNLSSSARSIPNVQQAAADPLKGIQVKRTPISAKLDPSASELLNSSTNIIPATFDERSRKIAKAVLLDTMSQVADRSKSTKHVEGNYNEFENESSEDESVGQGPILRDEPVVIRSRGNSKQMRNSLPSTQMDFGQSDKSSSIIDDGRRAKKRKRHTLLGPSKRVRHDQTRRMSAHEIDPDYNQMDRERARSRREYLSKIGHARSSEMKNQPSEGRIFVGLGTVTSQNSFNHSRALPSSPAIRQQVFTDTPDIHASEHRRVERDRQFRYSHLSNSSLYHAPTSTTMYAQFKTTYPNYGGQQKHFDASCQLLRKLQLQEKSTHPSLWDDFVFHHHHTYRQYLQEVIEECSSALSYEKFFESVEPSCRQRVMKAAYLDTIGVGLERSFQNHIPSPDPACSVNSPESIESIDRPLVKDVDARAEHVESRQLSKHISRVPSETVQQNKVDQQSQNFDQIIQHNDSQDSHTSVSIWLQRAGAESPVLGTPDIVDRDKEANIEALDITQEQQRSDSLPAVTPKQKKRRSLPWKSNNQTSTLPESSRNGAKSARPASTLPKTTTTRKTTPSASKHKPAPEVATRTNLRTVIPKEPSSRHSKPSPNLVLPSSSATAPAKHHTHTHTNAPSSSSSPFLWCLRQYRDLPSEKQAIERAQDRTRKVEVDISTWWTRK